MFKARIYCEAYLDDYERGQMDNPVNSWDTELTAETQEELRDKVLEETYSKWGGLDDEQMNGYDWCTEYHTSYMTNQDNEGEATAGELTQWRDGKLKLYAINCHILVTEVTEKKVSL